jgi:hypothetical protein
MTSRTWVGNQDHNNNASNPDNWNPRGVPRPGDSLVINSGTIAVSQNDLAGEILTVNLLASPPVVIDLTHANLQIASTPTFMSGGGSTAMFPPQPSFGPIISLAANVTLPLSNNLTAAAFVASQAGVFHGSSANSQPASVILAGLHATSFDLKTSMLRLFDGNTVVDTLRISNMTFGPITLAQNGSNIVLDFGATAPGTVLPQHV